MNPKTCHECHQSIKPGEMVLRSFSFKRVAFHRWCWNRAMSRAASDIL